MTRKREVAQPRPGFTLENIKMQTITAIPYDIIKEVGLAVEVWFSRCRSSVRVHIGAYTENRHCQLPPVLVEAAPIAADPQLIPWEVLALVGLQNCVVAVSRVVTASL